MAKRKPKPSPKRTRRSLDDRFLERNEMRLEHALAEQLMHATALAQLEAEIPRLRAIIAALRPEPAPLREPDPVHYTYRLLNSKTGETAMPNVPDHLKRFIQPKNDVAVVEDEDLLRPARLPGDSGEELLP